MPAFAAVLEFTDDAELRQKTRPAHREYLGGLLEAGNIRLSGPYTDDTGALIIYEAASLEEAQAFLEADPYRKAGVLADARIREWKIVMDASQSS